MKTRAGGGDFSAVVMRARRMAGNRHHLSLVLALSFVIFGATVAQAGVITGSILSVNLTNPLPMTGNGVSQITVTLFSSGIGNNPGRISVGSTAPDRYGDQNAQAGLNVSFVTADAVNITLTPSSSSPRHRPSRQASNEKSWKSVGAAHIGKSVNRRLA